MSTSSIQTAYQGITITYNERENKWEFVLRGRDRSVDSLKAAQDIIDKPAPKAKNFEKIPAWYFDYNKGPEKIEVTGIAENRSYGQQVWISNRGQRSKTTANDGIFPQSEKNDAIVATVIEKRAAMEKLRRECGELQRKLSPLVLPKEE